MSKRLAFTLSFLFLLLITITIAKLLEIKKEAHLNIPIKHPVLTEKKIQKKHFLVNDTIRIEHYFSYMDSLVTVYDSLTHYPLSEHILVKIKFLDYRYAIEYRLL